MEGFTPIWKTPTRSQAVEILRTCRAWTDGLVAELSPKQRAAPTPLGDGSWAVKDLLGHLATHEHRALITMRERRPSAEDERLFATVNQFNAHHLEVKRGWTLRKVESDYGSTRDELIAAIQAADDDRWLGKIPYGKGRSALGLVLAKMLNGDKYGYFAHDFALGQRLKLAVESLRST